VNHNTKPTLTALKGISFQKAESSLLLNAVYVQCIRSGSCHFEYSTNALQLILRYVSLGMFTFVVYRIWTPRHQAKYLVCLIKQT